MPRVIPHDHRCPICGTTEGHEDKFCMVTELYKVCDKPACQTRHAKRIIHQASTGNDILPCCGQLKSGTRPEDTMTLDPAKVTCRGRMEDAATSVS